jgi:hypothetical protein
MSRIIFQGISVYSSDQGVDDYYFSESRVIDDVTPKIPDGSHQDGKRGMQGFTVFDTGRGCE